MLKEADSLMGLKKILVEYSYFGPYSQSYVLPVLMYQCESWTVKKAE